MASSPYVAADGRPHIEIDWQAGARPSVPLDTIIDTGATRSAITQSASIGLTIKAYVSVGQASGRSLTAPLLSGGSMTIQVIDSSTKQTQLLSYSGDVLQLGANVLGPEVIGALSIRMLLDLGTTPPQVGFEI
jgi:hypothetical protein